MMMAAEVDDHKPHYIKLIDEIYHMKWYRDLLVLSLVKASTKS